MVTAVANLACGDVTGTVTFTQVYACVYWMVRPVCVDVTITLEGLTEGKHGFHIHQYGDTRNGCLAAGPHFNPFNMNHGAPTAKIRHVGDLGNIEADEGGKVSTKIRDCEISLVDPLTNIIGRAVVVHEKPDDLGLNPNSPESLITGNAGSRIGCAVIGLAKDSVTTQSSVCESD